MKRYILLLLSLLGIFSLQNAIAQTTVKRVMLQSFWWDYWNANYPGSWSNYLVELAPRLKSMGIDAVWVPPSTKADGGVNNVGYGPFDHYDLGDKWQKGDAYWLGQGRPTSTRMGTKDEYLRMIAVMHANGIEVVQDIVPNHTFGAGDLSSGGSDPDAPGDKFKLFRYASFATPAQPGNTAAEYITRRGRFPKNWQNFHSNPAHNCTTGDICEAFFGPDMCYVDGAAGQTAVSGAWDPDQATYSPYNNGGTGADNSYLRKHYREWLVWYKKQAGFDGVRMDAVKHFESAAAEDFLANLQFGAGWANGGNRMFAVGEWVGGASELDAWTTAVQKRSGTFDFGLRSGMKSMIDNGLFDIATLPGTQQGERVNFSAADNTFYHLTVPFVNNHDTFRPTLDANGNYTGWNSGQELAPHVDPFNPRMALAYAAMFAADGQPQIFFEDLFNVGGTGKRFSHRPDNITDMPNRSYIANLIWCHQNLDFKDGAYKIRSTAAGGNVFFESGAGSGDLLIIERSAKALIGINDRGDGVWQSAYVDSDFAPGTVLKDYSGANGTATYTVPSDKRVRVNTPPVDEANGRYGYSVWAPVGQDSDAYAPPRSPRTTQEWELADDLGDSHCNSLGQGGALPAGSTAYRLAGKIFVKGGTAVQYEAFREAPFAAETVKVSFTDLQGTVLYAQTGSGNLAGSFTPATTGWVVIRARNAVATNSAQKLFIKTDYEAPATVDVDLAAYKPANTVSIWTGNAGDGDPAQCRNWEEGKTPTATTDVVVPDGQTLSLTGSLTAMSVRNIIFQPGSAAAIPTGKSVEVYGIWTNATGAELAVCGTVVFKGAGLQAIQGPMQYCVLGIDNGGSVQTNALVKVTELLSLKSGNLITGSNEIFVTTSNPASIVDYTGGNWVQGNLRRAVNSTDAYVFPVGEVSMGQNAATVAFASSPAATSLLCTFTPGLTVSAVPQSKYTDINGDGIPDEVRYTCVYGGWQLTPSVPLTTPYTLTLAPSAALAATCAGGSFPTIGKDGDYTANSGLTKTFTGFSTFDVVTAASVVLPVQFISFTAHRRADGVQLQWKVEEDGSQKEYRVEWSESGAPFRILTTVGAQTGRGERVYNSTVALPNAATAYRIVAVDKDGAVQYSPIRRIAQVHGFSVQVSPNPSGGEIALVIGGTGGKTVNLQLRNALGALLYEGRSASSATLAQGINKALKGAPGGEYFLWAKCGDDVVKGLILRQ